MRRVVALVVLCIVAGLYVSPVQKYLRVQGELERQQAALADAQRQATRLADRHTMLQTDAAVILLARSCGWIFPGEHPLVVQGLPPDARAHCR
jgi:hypothetical protein